MPDNQQFLLFVLKDANTSLFLDTMMLIYDTLVGAALDSLIG